MAHARKQIRDAVSALLTGLSTTGQRVYPSRAFSLEESELPSISVFTANEAVTRTTMAPIRYHRDLEVIIEGHAVADELVDDSLDQISAEVEVAMSGALVADGVTLSTQLLSTASSLSGEGESQVGVIRLTYTIPYSTLESTPESLG